MKSNITSLRADVDNIKLENDIFSDNVAKIREDVKELFRCFDRICSWLSIDDYPSLIRCMQSVQSNPTPHHVNPLFPNTASVSFSRPLHSTTRGGFPASSFRIGPVQWNRDLTRGVIRNLFSRHQLPYLSNESFTIRFENDDSFAVVSFRDNYSAASDFKAAFDRLCFLPPEWEGFNVFVEVCPPPRF